MTDEWKDSRKILLFDIETFPSLGYTWGKYEQNVLHFVKDWELASCAYKWLNDKRVYCVSRQDFKDKTDASLTKSIWEIFNEAEVIIAHNGDQFDIKKSQAKFIEHNLPPPAPHKSVDTKKLAKSRFMFTSNSLNDLAQTLKLGKKLETGGFDLWLKCMAGDKQAWKKMIEYNKQDVVLLEKVYLKMRMWANNHPHIGHLDGDKFACKVCGSLEYKKQGRRLMLGGWKARVQCLKCGRWDAVSERSLLVDEQMRQLGKKA